MTHYSADPGWKRAIMTPATQGRVWPFPEKRLLFMKTPREWAAILNGREMGDEVSRDEAREMKTKGIVAVFGASDDLCEFRGAIHGEEDCYNGWAIQFDQRGVCTPPTEEEMKVLKKHGWDGTPAFKRVSFDAIWCQGDIPWTYKVPFEHETFDIMEDGEVFCRGFVFRLEDAL